MLREDDGKTGLNVLMPNASGDTITSTLNTIKSLPKGTINKATIPNKNAMKNPQNNKFRVTLGTNDGNNVDASDVKKMNQMGSEIGATAEIDFKNENFVRYSKKELKEILFQ